MDTVLRVAFAYAFVWVCFRVLGKRELTELAPFELVTLLFIPQMFSRALTRQDYSITNAVIAATTLLLLVFLTSMTVYRSRRAAKVVLPRATILVERGHFIERHLDQERISPTEVFDAMHATGVERLDQVRWALLQPNGRIAVIPEWRVLPSLASDANQSA